MKKIVVMITLAIVLTLSACGQTKDTQESMNQNTIEHNDPSNKNTITNQGYVILEQPEGKLPTILLYDKDGVKLTLSEPDPILLEKAESQKGKTFERAGMLTLENKKDFTVGIGFGDLYVNRIKTDENILNVSAETGKTEKLIIDLTIYKNLFMDEISILENGEIYSLTFQTSFVDINAGWVPFDSFDYYIPIKDEEKQQAFLEKFISKENLCFENDDLAIYLMQRYDFPESQSDSQIILKYYEFIFQNKTDKYLDYGQDMSPSSLSGKTVKDMLWPLGGISAGNYDIGYLALHKVDHEGKPNINYDEFKQQYEYSLYENLYGEEITSGEFDFVFKPADFGLETTATLEEVYYKR